MGFRKLKITDNGPNGLLNDVSLIPVREFHTERYCLDIRMKKLINGFWQGIYIMSYINVGVIAFRYSPNAHIPPEHTVAKVIERLGGEARNDHVDACAVYNDLLRHQCGQRTLERLVIDSRKIMAARVTERLRRSK